MKTANNTWSSAFKSAAFLIVFIFILGQIQSGRGAGVTIITHGFNDNATSGWIPAMVNAIINRNFAGDNSKVSVYQIYVTDNGSGGLTVSHGALIGGNPLTTTSGEIFVELDWSTLTTGWDLFPGVTFHSTTDIATAVEAKLTDPNFISDLGGRSLSSLPMHLIGHSRGGSLVCEISRLLGQQGIWIDQLTTLDPHPVCDYPPDGTPNIYENVLYADNYYQTVSGSSACDAINPSGVYIDGANYRVLTSLSGGYPVDYPIDYSAHLDVHFWYHGTIDTSATASDGTASFTTAMRNTWYNSYEFQGQFAGFYYSRLGGGLTDDNGPFFGLYNEGDFNNSPDNRVSLAIRNSNEWPNLIQLAHDTTGSVQAGNAFPLKYVFQSFDSSSSVTVYLDPDQNPYNGNGIALSLTPNPNPQSSTARGTRTINAGGIVPASTLSGLYYVYAMITNPNGTRYLYSLNQILVTANSGGNGSAATTTSVSPTTLPTSSSTQLINIYGTNFKPTGDPNASMLIFYDPAKNSYLRTPIYISANQLQYNVTVQSATGSWSVIVTNAGLAASNPQTFSVYTAAANTGSLVVNLSPAGAVSAGAQWQVDGTGYNNSGQAVGSLTPGQHQITFKSISGYSTPASFAVNVVASQQTTTNATYTAVAPSTYLLSLNYNSTQGGASASPSASGNNYTAGAVVQIYASASSGYHFTGWSGDASGTANPTTITMNVNKTVTANFASGDPSLGTLTVTILPQAAATAGVTWGFNANDFRASGSSYTTFPASYFITLHPVAGWLGPTMQLMTITAGQTTNVNVTFTQDTTPGLLTVTLSPPSVVTAGAQWHVNGGAYGNGASVSLPPGNYTVTFDAASGWSAPASQNVTVQRAQTTVASGNYTPPAGQPSIVSIQPSVGALAGGTQLTIQGLNFAAPATVLVGGQPATNVTVVCDSQITCFTPSNSFYGTAPVVVQSASGNTTNLNGFAYGFPRGNGITLAGSIGGYMNAIAAQGNYCYTAEGSTFTILDVSNPSAPSPISRLAMPGQVEDIALFTNSGHQYAAVADGDAGLQIVDITTPTTPTLRGYYNTGDWANGVAVLGSTAYLANGNSGFSVLDISIPIRPQLIGSLGGIGYSDRLAVQASGSNIFAYVSAGGGLAVVDASAPNNPVLRGTTSAITQWWEPHSLAIFGNRVFLVDDYDYMQAIDISNPNSPSALGSVTGDAPSAVTVANGLLYTWGGQDLTIYNVVGGNLQRVGFIQNSSPFQGDSIVILGGSAICAGGQHGLFVYDISTPSSPAYRGAFGATAGYYLSAAVNGTNAFLATQNSGLKVFDVSNLGNPVLLSQFIPWMGSGSKVKVSGNRAYFLGAGQINVLDVSDPTKAPVLLGTNSQTRFFVFDFYLLGSSIVSAGFDTTFTPYKPAISVFNANNPASIIIQQPLYFSTQNGGVGSIAGNGTVAYGAVPLATGNDSSLATINISNPANLQQVGQLGDIGDVEVGTMRLSPDNHYLYVGCYDSNWKIVDLTTNTSPVLVSSNAVDSTVFGIDFYGSAVVVAEGHSVLLYDVSNPSQPRVIRSYSMPRQVSDVEVAGNALFVADTDAGFSILKLTDIDSPEIFITAPTSSPIVTNTTGTLNLSGTADDNLGLVQGAIAGVTWANNQGGGGNATGTTNWSVSGITLLPGTNILSLTATDTSGNSSNATLTVIYQTTNQNQTITFPAIADHTFGDPPIQLVAAASSGLPVSFSVVAGPAILSSSNVLTLTGAGAVTLEADQAGNSGFNPATPVDVSFNVARANQSLAFAPVPNHPASDPPFSPAATTSSGLPVYFSILAGPATLDTNNNLTLLAAGSVTLVAWQPGNSNYNAAATVQQSFNVSKIPQTITFVALSPQKQGDAPFPLNAAADSGLLVSYSISGPATLSGNILTLTGHGTVTVTASQSGNSSYAAATPVVQSFAVAPPDNTLVGLGFQNHSFQMAFYGIVGSNYTVQASSNLLNWQPFTNFTVTNSPFNFIDSAATNFNKRFYRAGPP